MQADTRAAQRRAVSKCVGGVRADPKERPHLRDDWLAQGGKPKGMNSHTPLFVRNRIVATRNIAAGRSVNSNSYLCSCLPTFGAERKPTHARVTLARVGLAARSSNFFNP